jgi:hypothetical protein
VRVQLAVACCPEGGEISESASAVPVAAGFGSVDGGAADETPAGPEPQGEFTCSHWVALGSHWVAGGITKDVS